jgi:LCP family protein required for cell wall assembly
VHPDDIASANDAGMFPVGSRSNRRSGRVATFLVLTVLVAGATVGGVLVAAHSAIGTVHRLDTVTAALSSPSGSVENFLLVGSDSRANSDPNSPDFGGIGGTGDVQGSRSDTIMVLRRDRVTGAAALLSIPRDLWVTAAGTGKRNRINAVYNSGPDALVATIREALGIPIHHYVEIDFSGFKSLVDAIGGVQICFLYPTRDTNTGLNVVEPGCHLLGGVQALAFARSRHYQEFRDGDWHEDGTADLGRTKRQRQFVDTALVTTLARLQQNPFLAGDLIRSSGSSLTVDADLDVIVAANSLRTAVGGGLATYALPVRGTTIDGKSVLLLGDGSDAVLAYFRGDGPAPAATT